MVTLNIKPLSVNDAWQGKRFKTQKYKSFEQHMLEILPDMDIDPQADLKVTLEFGMSSSASDLDNPVKCTIDCLQKKFLFNDKKIQMLIITKTKTTKGNEYIKFKIEEIKSAL